MDSFLFLNLFYKVQKIFGVRRALGKCNASSDAGHLDLTTVVAQRRHGSPAVSEVPHLENNPFVLAKMVSMNLVEVADLGGKVWQSNNLEACLPRELVVDEEPVAELDAARVKIGTGEDETIIPMPDRVVTVDEEHLRGDDLHVDDIVDAEIVNRGRTAAECPGSNDVDDFNLDLRWGRDTLAARHDEECEQNDGDRLGDLGHHDSFLPRKKGIERTLVWMYSKNFKHNQSKARC